MSKLSLSDQVRFGAAGAKLKSELKPKQWRKLVRTAHKQGYTVEGAISGAPNALKERTPASLRQEAVKTVKAAYKPSLVEITHQEKRVNALDTKRAADNKAYQEWLTGQTGLLNAQARAADSALLDRQREIAQQSSDAWDQAQTAAHANAAASVGNVSDPNQSTALNLAPAAQHTSDQIANQRQITAQMIGSSEANQGIASTSVLSASLAADSKRQSDTQAARQGLQDERAKVRSARAGDIAKEASRLLDNEVTKAQNQRDFSAAASKLGIDQQKLKLDFLKEKHNYDLGLATLNLNKWKEQNTGLWRQAQTQLGYDKIAATDGQKAADRALRKWIARHKKTPKTGPSDSQRKSATKAYNDNETARGIYEDLISKFPDGKTKNGETYRQRLRDKGVSDVMIDVVVDLRKNKGKLSSAGYAKAKSLGIAHYYQRVPKDSNQGRTDAQAP